MRDVADGMLRLAAAAVIALGAGARTEATRSSGNA